MSYNFLEPDLIIRPKRNLFDIDLKDLWRYRGLIKLLVRRDFVSQYKQTVLGVVWAILQPFATMIILTVVFSKIAKLPSEGSAPYAVMVFAAMLPWQLFANSLTGCSNSLISNANLISKVYFPRLIIPASAVVVALADFLIAMAMLIIVMLWYRFVPSAFALALPLFILMAFLTAMGAGLWLASLNVKYRDFRYIVPFIVQFGLYISPVGFSSSVIPEKWQLLYSLNPMVGVINGFRWALLGGQSYFYWPGFLISSLVIFFLLLSGIHHFRRMEKTFADVI